MRVTDKAARNLAGNRMARGLGEVEHSSRLCGIVSVISLLLSDALPNASGKPRQTAIAAYGLVSMTKACFAVPTISTRLARTFSTPH